MPYQTLDEANVTSLQGLFSYTSDIVPIFPALMLFAVFMITMLGSYFSQKRLEGRGDFPASFALAGFFTAVIAIFVSLITDFINSLHVVISMVVALVSVILLLISKDR